MRRGRGRSVSPAAGVVEGEAGDGAVPVRLPVLEDGTARLHVPHFDGLQSKWWIMPELEKGSSSS